MQFISVRDLRSKSSALWKRLQTEREMVLTSNGKPIAVLSAVSETNLEETLRAIRRSVAVSSLTCLQNQSIRSGLDTMPLAEINSAITSVRKRKQA